jgi:4-carboxymuconolactone decarboxylase
VDRQMYEKGLEIRTAVMGKPYVDKALNSATEFDRPMQDFIMEYAWGAIWGREGLPHKVRSMLNLAMISMLNRPHELRGHIRGALNNGVTKDEIREVFMQVGVYAGAPVALDAFRIAKEMFAEMEKDG